MANLTQLMENEVLMTFAFYTIIVFSKMMFVSSVTAISRMTRKVFANPEDCSSFGKGENAKKI
ncbi:microsomal glutathione S-transferase 1-like [Tamandua tetradactyla]|uniref:microsomal glutathione S-transferase 1-like n=1 Tax=Tamandua tetradactyla TaxID=48850 RepID=UPI004053FD2E